MAGKKANQLEKIKMKLLLLEEKAKSTLESRSELISSFNSQVFNTDNMLDKQTRSIPKRKHHAERFDV